MNHAHKFTRSLAAVILIPGLLLFSPGKAVWGAAVENAQEHWQPI